MRPSRARFGERARPLAPEEEGAAVQFPMDAFGHLKAIGANDGARPLLNKAGVEEDEGITHLGDDFIAAAHKRFYAREPKVRMLA